MQFNVQRDSSIPLYQQIVGQVRQMIRSGMLPAGARLPPVRQLAADYGLTRLTVHSAYEELQAQGLIESFVGRGTFVAATDLATPNMVVGAMSPAQWTSQSVLAEMLRMPEGSDMISLAHAFPAPEAIPIRELGASLQRAAAEPAAWGYGPIQGDAALRGQISNLLRERGVPTPPEHMLITAGAQHAIDVTLRALVSPGDVILVEEPTYPGVLELAAQRGQRMIGVPGDDDGIQIGALAAACARFSPRLLYLVPAYGNPTGVSLVAQRRADVLRLARTHDMLILEDDVYGLLPHEGSSPTPLRSLDRTGQVIFVSSFSKTLAPALRLGALVADTSLLPALSAARQASDLVSSMLLQRALADFLRGNHLEPHLATVRALYRERRDAMVAALQRHLPDCTWTYPKGGLSLWVKLPDSVIERDFCTDAAARGVGVTPGRALFATPQRAASMRLSFGMQSPQRIEQAVVILGDILQEHLRRRAEMFSRAHGVAEPLV